MKGWQQRGCLGEGAEGAKALGQEEARGACVLGPGGLLRDGTGVGVGAGVEWKQGDCSQVLLTI